MLFDFDGTIADTLREGLRIYNEIAPEKKYTPVTPEQIDELRALETRELLKHLGVSRREIPSLVGTALRRLKERVGQLPLIAGMEEVLPQLRERVNHLGLLSSNAPVNVRSFLEAHKIMHLFTSIECTGKLGGKAKRLRVFAHLYGFDREDILYVGDEIRDLRAARKAGIVSVAVAWGFNSEASLARENPDYLIRSPQELLGIVE